MGVYVYTCVYDATSLTRETVINCEKNIWQD